MIVYSAEWCSGCKSLKQYLESKNVEFTEIDIDKSEEAVLVLQQHRLRSIPQVFVGEKLIGGLNEVKQYLEEK